ncbi:hypothetical protein FACS1894166_00110 [Bacilli bacterium]|nr:hypothetical protein FACS1894166_00110 [Bacilli bacterium]
MYVTFQTTYCDVNPDSLLVAYVGSMTLNFTKNIVLNDSGFALGKDDVIQCVYSFSDVTLSSETTTTDN